MQVEVHLGDGGSGEVNLLAVEAQGAGVASGRIHRCDRLDQHASGAAGWVGDGLPRLRVEQFHDEVHDVAGCEELAGLFAGGVGEFPQQVLVGAAEHVAANGIRVEPQFVECAQQCDERRLGEPFGVGPIDIAEDAIEGAGVRLLNGQQGGSEFVADVLDGVVDVAPVASVGNLKDVEVGLDLVVEIGTEFGCRPGVIEVPGVADPLEEQRREHVTLEVGRVDRATQGVRGVPEGGFQLTLAEVNGIA